MGAEGDGHVGAHVRAVDLAGVDLDAGRGVHGDAPARRRAPRPPRPRRRAGPPCPPMPTIPSTTTSGRRGLLHRADHAAARGAQRGEPGGVRLLGAEQHAPRPARRAGPAARRRTARRRRCRPRRRAAAPGAPYTGPSRSSDGVRQPGRRPLHQRPLGQPRHQRRLGRPDLLDGVCAAHAAKLPSAGRAAVPPTAANPRPGHQRPDRRAGCPARRARRPATDRAGRAARRSSGLRTR